MQKCKVILQDEVYCRVVGIQPEHNEFLWKQFGIEIEGAFFMPAVKLGRWDGKIRFYEKTGKTYIRLLDEIIPIIVGWGYDVDLDDKRVPVNHPTYRIHENHFIDFIGYGGKPVTIRPYQCEVINTLIEAGSGFAIAGTGAGKTLITAGLCDVYGLHGFRTITIVPSGDLVSQTKEAFEMVGMDVGEYSGDKKELDNQHVIATWQSLQNNPHIMKLFQVVLVDEAHGTKGAVIQELINVHGSHIAFRFGVTGTFPRPKSDQYTLISSIGPILIEVKSSWLIANGYLSEIEIEIVQTQEDADLPDYPSERAFLSKKEERLEFLAGMIQQKMRQHGNTMVLVNSIQFGRKLQKLIPGSVFLSGESEKDLRKENYDQYADRDDVIVIATSGIASTGISIDRIFCLFLIDAGKSFIKAIQSVGRGLRRAHDKNRVHVVDVASNLKYSKKHAKDRIKFYKEAEYPHSAIVKVRY